MTRLTAPHMERCIGCFLCVLESSRGRGNISLEDSALRIIPVGDSFTAQIDAGIPVSSTVAKICPRNCLELIDD